MSSKKKTLEIPYWDSCVHQFQLKQDGNPVDITDQTLIFYIAKKDDESFTPIEKDIDDEGWFVDAQNGIFKVIFDTEGYVMAPGIYQAEIEWVDEETSLVFYDIRVFEDIRHQPS
jgi:hypothetical protein